ncbi:helix-turn-helix domain-containing protein [Corynebacterium sp. 13CS0277]|uniref:AraC-like ligand-binding domain-containing protein n=1 Tax=Corynebacterium sp. 13CS0277 TaxID=2071994 RepID=UPI00130505D8|nr:helix-turn-helix domain-containing protein [Corynebacterium sp. 13CS0277]
MSAPTAPSGIMNAPGRATAAQAHSPRASSDRAARATPRAESRAASPLLLPRGCDAGEGAPLAPAAGLHLPVHTLDSYRQAVARGFNRLEFEAHDPDAFWGVVDTASHGRVSFHRIQGARHTVRKLDRHIGPHDTHFVKFTVQLGGETSVTQGGRTAVCGPGDVVAYGTSTPFEVEFGQEADILIIQVERTMVPLADAALQAALVRSIPGQGVAAPAVSFFQSLANTLHVVEHPAGQHYATGSVAMIGPLLGQVAAEWGVGMDERSQLLAAIDTYIDEHLGEEGLSPASVAAAHFISVRYLHSLFQERGTTVCQLVREKRLRAALGMLQDPTLSGVGVASIGARVGMTNPAQFSRSFKARYGRSPRQVRQGAQMA